MNGFELYNKVLTRLGFSRYEQDSFDEGLLKRVLELINQIAADLQLEGIKTLSENMNYNFAQTEAICCGVAMLFSLSEGDSEKNKIYTALYNSKRAALLSKTAYVEDVLPKVNNGVE